MNVAGSQRMLYFFFFQVELEMKLKAYEKLIACEQATAK